MKRVGFKRKTPEGYRPDPDRVRSTPSASAAFRLPVAVEAPVAAIEKEGALQNWRYMHEVKQLPCKHCGKHPPCDFAHRDQTKGLGLKTDCREGFPLCRLCHDLLGSSGKIPRDERRALEERYGRETRAQIRAAGRWPSTLPEWAHER